MNEKVLFGVRAIVPGGTSLLELRRETYQLLRMKKHEVDQALMYAEDLIERKGIP